MAGKTLLETFCPDTYARLMADSDALLSVTEAATRLGVSSRRVRALIDAGRLPAQKIGRTWVIREADLAKVTERPQGWPKGRPRRQKPL